MKISYNWLKEYVDINFSPEELAEKLTMAGIEVEEIISTLPKFEGIKVAEVLAVRKHPNADKLSLCDIKTSHGVTEIICGAPNVAEGQKIPFAGIGTVHKGEVCVAVTSQPPLDPLAIDNGAVLALE